MHEKQRRPAYISRLGGRFSVFVGAMFLNKKSETEGKCSAKVFAFAT